jgi:hypothetical protein
VPTVTLLIVSQTTAPQTQAPTAAAPEDDVLMTVTDVARRSQLSVTAVRRAIRACELKATWLRSQVRVAPADYDNWVESGRKVQQQQPQTPRVRAPRQPRQPAAGSFRALARADDQAQAL